MLFLWICSSLQVFDVLQYYLVITAVYASNQCGAPPVTSDRFVNVIVKLMATLFKSRVDRKGNQTIGGGGGEQLKMNLYDMEQNSFIYRQAWKIFWFKNSFKTIIMWFLICKHHFLSCDM